MNYICKKIGLPCSYADSNGDCVGSSCFYEDKWVNDCIIPKFTICTLPDEITINGVEYVKKQRGNDREKLNG